jgi:hypothetical protein
MCCGRDRVQQRTAPGTTTANRQVYAANAQPQPRPTEFVYAGNTSLTVTGPVSGIRYRFDRPGARLNVDARDRVLLASIRQLQQVG